MLAARQDLSDSEESSFEASESEHDDESVMQPNSRGRSAPGHDPRIARTTYPEVKRVSHSSTGHDAGYDLLPRALSRGSVLRTPEAERMRSAGYGNAREQQGRYSSVEVEMKRPPKIEEKVYDMRAHAANSSLTDSEGTEDSEGDAQGKQYLQQARMARDADAEDMKGAIRTKYGVKVKVDKVEMDRFSDFDTMVQAQTREGRASTKLQDKVRVCPCWCLRGGGLTGLHHLDAHDRVNHGDASATKSIGREGGGGDQSSRRHRHETRKMASAAARAKDEGGRGCAEEAV